MNHGFMDCWGYARRRGGFCPAIREIRRAEKEKGLSLPDCRGQFGTDTEDIHQDGGSHSDPMADHRKQRGIGPAIGKGQRTAVLITDAGFAKAVRTRTK